LPKSKLLHLNKHLDSDDPTLKGRFSSVKLWKLNIFNTKNAKTYDTVISFADLSSFFETEFISKQP
jgi:hypothetical protein